MIFQWPNRNRWARLVIRVGVAALRQRRATRKNEGPLREVQEHLDENLQQNVRVK